MITRTLVVTRDMMPHKIVPWDRSVMMLFQAKIRVVEEYAGDEHVVGVLRAERHREFKHVVAALGSRVQPGCDAVIRTPAVVSLIKAVGSVKRGVKFSRINVFTRDGFRCQYCRQTMAASALTYDHVTPRCQGGKTVWENITTACRPCNTQKGDRSPEKAGMRLIKRPYKPKVLPMLGPRFSPLEMHPVWIPYMTSFVDCPESVFA